MDARALHKDKTTRQLLYWQLEDMGIDATSPIGLFVIANYRPAYSNGPESVMVHSSEAIQEFIDRQWTGGI